MQKLRILYQDEYCVGVEKPAGVLVHPSIERGKVPLGKVDVIRMLRAQLEERVFPIHRLDRATSGVLIVARTSLAAREFQKMFQAHQMQKKYVALVRGWTENEGVIDSPLTKRLDGGALVEAHTEYQTLSRVELPIENGKYKSSRFSLVHIQTKTGRLHQIRRHFKRIAHPLIGDTVHGDGRQNQIFRALTGDHALYLKAYALMFTHPINGERVSIRSRWNGMWHRMFDQIHVCPWLE